MEGSVTERNPGRERAVAAAIAALALALRLALLFTHPRPLASDALEYDQLGWTLATTGRYAAADGAPTAYRAPGYPAFLAAVYALAGHHPAAAKAAQGALDAATAVLLYALLSRRSRTAAIIAGLAWALFPPALLFANDLLSETLFTFGAVAFAWLVARDRPRSDVAAGVVLAGLVLTKPAALLFAAALPLALSRRGSARPTTLILVTAIVPVLAWIARNELVMNTPALVTSAGTNLWIGNNPLATGGYAEPAPVATLARGEVAAGRAAGHEALAYAARHPGRTLVLGAKKLMLLASSEAELTAGAFTRADTGSRMRDRYRAVPAWIRVLVSVPTLGILILALFGFASGAGGLERRLFGALLFAVAASSLVFFGSSRFRFPLMPFLVLLAAEFIAAASHRVRAMSRGSLVAASAACAAIVAVWIAEALVLSGAISV